MSKLTEEISKKMAKYCFTNLAYYLYTGEPVTVLADLNELKLPVYVTWLKDGELRGCIG